VKAPSLVAHDAVSETLKPTLIAPGDARYQHVQSTFFRGGAPKAVFQTRAVDQVVAAIEFATAQAHLPLSVRSGGHGIRGRSTNTGGVVVDLSPMNKIEVLNPSTRLVRIGPGARWVDVAEALAPHGWALSSGDSGDVGVGGLATAGGIGLLGRAHGLTIDSLRAVELVTADGSIVRTSQQEDPELFWAVRGAGSQFGIATAFEFQAHEVGNVGWAQLVFDASDVAGFLEHWGSVVETSPRDVTSFLILSVPRTGHSALAFVTIMINADNPQIIQDRLRPFERIARCLQRQVTITPYASVMADSSSGVQAGRGEPVSRSGSLAHITRQFAGEASRFLRGGAAYFFQVRSMGGAISDVGAEQTAFGSRAANFEVTAAGHDRDRLNVAWDLLHPYFSGLYLTFDTDPRPERVQEAFPPRTLERLRELKQRFDPNSLFADNFSLRP